MLEEQRKRLSEKNAGIQKMNQLMKLRPARGPRTRMQTARQTSGRAACLLAARQELLNHDFRYSQNTNAHF